MAERSNAAVLKTVDGQLSGGSNPSLSAKSTQFEPKRNKLSAFSIFAVFAQFSQVAFIQLHFRRRVRRSVVEDINAIVE